MRAYYTILFALIFAFGPVFSLGWSSCDCCADPAEHGEMAEDASAPGGCCAPQESDEPAAPDRPADSDRKCPMSCCAASIPTAFVMSGAVVMSPSEPGICAEDDPVAYAGPTTSGLKRPPRALLTA